MDIVNKKLERWAQQLLDTGKRNNLINFKDTKASTVEVVFPDANAFYEKCLSLSSFEVYDPKIADDEDDVMAVASAYDSTEDNQGTNIMGSLSKKDYTMFYTPRIRKQNQVLVFARTPNPITAIRNIDKKARDFLEETGVNVAYLAFGFVHWKENEHSDIVYKAPLLLVPVILRNSSSITPYHIELTEDDVVINPTFDYLLGAQYGTKLPEYEEDELLSSYLEKVRSIVSKLHWEVTADCKLGIFSFLKINMYHDLMNNANKILQNNIVRSLLGENPIDTERTMLIPQEDVVTNEVIDLHTVVDADSSQIEAIKLAKSGKNIVLQGPPGTGKSQTITNIIAECLHDGKKVLFVSEKLAALSVVYDKLKQAGLEEFCLELHSHKASKKEVISELCKTLRANRSSVSPRAEREVQTKAELQKKLDSYAEELHVPIPGINKSLYQLYDAHSAYRNAPDLEIVLDDIVQKDETYLTEAVNLLKQYEEYVPTIGEDFRKNEWYGYNNTNGTYESQNRLKQDIQVILNGLTKLAPVTNACKKEYNLKLGSINHVERYIQLFSVLAFSTFLQPQIINPERIGFAQTTVDKLSELSSQILPLRQQINSEFEDGFYQINGLENYNKLVKLYSGLFSRLFNAEYKSIISDIRLQSKTGKKPNYNAALEHMKRLSDFQNLAGQFTEVKKGVEGLLVTSNLSFDTDWNRLKAELEAISSVYSSGLNCGIISDMTDNAFTEAKSSFGNYAKSMATPLQEFKQVLLSLQNDFDPQIISFDSAFLDVVFTKLNKCMESIDRVENWIRFNILHSQLSERGLLPFVICTIDNHIPSDQIASSYQKLFYKQWINHVIYENPVFSGFTRISHDKIVEQFAQKDKLQFEISKAQIKAELSAKRPSLDMMAGGSAVSILLREGDKKRKQKSIRKLLEETGELVQVIKPCFLMSPLSVSTFLSGNGITFDTVIFDEASQIFPQDAIGAIYRGKQLIVVGDLKQMPPSNFFNSSVESDDDDEETGDVTDFESILNICSNSYGLISRRLAWHYRSHYEQLIAFSNKNYYDNTLITFPSAQTDRKGVGVDYYHVNGVFDRKSHTNKIEAEYVVDLVFRHIDQYPNRSLGVVAFSIAQQALIDRLLSKRRQDDPSKEWFFNRDETNKEPFFVKNLETVQGDERDTIIFSVAYGIDAQGRRLQNYGPLNRTGGERRLNVAVTRAKDNIQLVSSMHAVDIDLSRTSAEGARLLREYLDYAENGQIALDRSVTVNPFEEYDSEFEMDVCDFLRSHGFSLDTQVGCSNFKIDIGLKRPDSSDYVLAIECDGATYHSSKNARDRDRLRQEILERMGWRFYRIWSTDWFKNTAVEKERLLQIATEAIHLGPYIATKEPDPQPIFEQTIAPKHLAFPKYKEADVVALRQLHPSGVLSYVKSILEIEAPVSEEYLLKRICFIYDREKVTNVVKEQFAKSMRGCEGQGIIRKNGFLYLDDNKPLMLRVPGVKRDIKYISPEELATGLYVLLKQNYTADKEGLYRTLVNQLGFTRVNDSVCERLDEALSLLNNVTVDGDTVSFMPN